MRILVADKLSQVGIDWLRQQGDVELEVRPGLSPEELGEVVGACDGMIIRSGVKVDRAVLASAGRLKVIARAGVGVDNVDVPLATEMGIVVMNTPDGNTISTAELALALMLSLSRRIAQASASLRSGRWDRKAFEGTQLSGKTLAVIGMGRIGQAVALRAAALGMRVLGYDPFFAGRPEAGVEMVDDLSDICRQADYLTVHVPKTPQTEGMIGAEQIAMMKPTVRLINAARGGVIDEAALLGALKEGRIAGAALDVYSCEPPDSGLLTELIGRPNVLAVPHLGASTEEAQDQVALQAAEQVVEFLRGNQARNAVNAPGFAEGLSPMVRAYGALAWRMGLVLAMLAPKGLREVEVVYEGELAEANTAPIAAHALAGLLSPHMEIPVNVINAPVLAEQRGLEVRQVVVDRCVQFAHRIEVRVKAGEEAHFVAGTVFVEGIPRITSIDGYAMEMNPQGHVLLVMNRDVPGVVGRLGTILGKHGVNIADMTLSRDMVRRTAVMGIRLDTRPGDEVVREIRSQEFVNAVYLVDLPELDPPSR